MILNMYCFATVKKGFVLLQPRLQGALSLKQKGPLNGVHGESRVAKGTIKEPVTLLFKRKSALESRLGPRLVFFAFLKTNFFDDTLFLLKSSSIHTICNIFFDRKLLILIACLRDDSMVHFPG